MKNVFLANIIRYLHLYLIMSVLSIPFMKNKEIVRNLYLIFVPFMMIRWYTNNDTCCLTILESKLRNVKKEESFFNSCISPVYKVSEYKMGYILKIVTIILLFCACYNLKEFEVRIYDY